MEKMEKMEKAGKMRKIGKIAVAGLWAAAALLLVIGCGTQGGGKPDAPPAAEPGEVTFYITRHGRTLFNTMNRVQGWSDTPLTPEGIETAQFLGKGLKDIRFDYVISSDLTRAIQTARLVMAENTADSTTEFMQSDMLRELCFGSFEGDLDPNMIAAVCAEGGYENFEAIAEAVGPAQNGVVTADLVKKLDTSGMAEDGETVKNRMQTKLRQIAEEQEARGGGTVLLVSHGVSITIMLSDLDPSFQDHVVRLANAAVCKVVYKDGGFKIISFNDTSYIEKGRA